jgi:hypothetical protein
MTFEYPWDLRAVPNFHSAFAVDVEQGERLDARTFERRYVLRNRPCLIKRAIAGWPAFERWREAGYLASKIGDLEVRASCTPRIEGFGLRSRREDASAARMTEDAKLAARPLRAWLPQLQTPDRDVLFVELRPADAGVRPLGDDLVAAGERFPFLPHPPRPRFFYSGWAVMLYKNSYSDWHFHPGADAIMCQVLGTKDVLLLPPTQRSWDQIVPVHRAQWKVYGVDVTKMPAFGEVHPYHAVVEPGDGLFLPLHWWHAVQARPREFGITVPVTWDSPFRDLRQPASRQLLRMLWQQRRKPLAAAELLAGTYGTLASAMRQPWSR